MAEPEVSDDVLGRAVHRRDAAAAPRRRGRGGRDPGPPAGRGPAVRARRCCTSTASADYFFQTGRPTSGCDRGYDFYALDLRKYGRSLRPHQTPNYVADLRHLLRGARPRPSSGSPRTTTTSCFSAHSTGGLTVPLWLHDRGHCRPQASS